MCRVNPAYVQTLRYGQPTTPQQARVSLQYAVAVALCDGQVGLPQFNATRVQGDRDIFMIPGAKGNELDPIQDVYGYITKIGIDATKPLARAERFELARIPGADAIDLRDYLG